MALSEQQEQVVERVMNASQDIIQTVTESVVDRIENDDVGYVTDNITEEVAVTMEELAEHVRNEVNGVTIIFDLDNDNSSEDQQSEE